MSELTCDSRRWNKLNVNKLTILSVQKTYKISLYVTVADETKSMQ